MATPSLLSRVIESRGQDEEIVSIKDRVQFGTGDEGWTVHADGSLRYRGQVVVPQLTDLREEILREFHYSRFVVHPGARRCTRIFIASTVDHTRSTGRRDLLLNGRKMWIDFRILKNPSSRRTVFLWSHHLLLFFIFKWGKPSKNKKPQ